MTQGEFNGQMQRLLNHYRGNAYSEEFSRILWREVQIFSGEWFTKTVSLFIGNNRYAPLMPEFREELSKERERRWKIEQEENAQQAKDFWEGTYQPEEVASISEMLKKRMRRQVQDDEWEQFLKHLKMAAK